MPKAILKPFFLISLALTAVLLAGCTDPEARRAEAIEEARQLFEAGEATAALNALEALSADFPNYSEILALIGSIHGHEGDTVSAAFYLEQAYRLNPDDMELLYQTYRAQEAAGQPAAPLLETLAAQSPESMSPPLWIRLGEYRAAENRPQAALDAFLRELDPESETADPKIAVEVGQQFLKLDNLPQAERWFAIAAESDEPAAQTALLGTLEIHLRRKEWAEAEQTIARLDRQFPGAVDAGEWAGARAELQKWRAAQERMRSELARAEAAKKAAEEAAEAEAEAAARSSEAGDASPTSAEAGGETTTGKGQVVADLEAAEALALAPAIEPEEPEEPAVAFNPEIAIEPAEPDFGITVNYDQEGSAGPADFTVETDAPASPETAATAGPSPEPPAPVRSVEDLLAEAEDATLAREFDRAINLYWQILGRANSRADVWNRLSQVYLMDDDIRSAETAALEATRLAPDDIAYALDYLRVAQRTKTSRDFLGELETAYARFPRNPEVTLSLARAYERISRNTADARALYSRFIELAPNHPLRPEAETALARLR